DHVLTSFPTRRSSDLNYGVTSKPNHFSDRRLIVPSAFAASMASSNIFFSSASSLRKPTPTPRPRMPPLKNGPVMTMSSLPGFLRSEEHTSELQSRENL